MKTSSLYMIIISCVIAAAAALTLPPYADFPGGHNAARREIGVFDLRYNTGIEGHAKEVAKWQAGCCGSVDPSRLKHAAKLQDEHDNPHTPAQVMNQWLKDNKSYSQIVSGAIQQMGCGQSDCSGAYKFVSVCLYD